LILGAWTGLFSLLIGLTLAWAVSRTDVPAKKFIQATATLSYLLPPFLTAIAFTYLFSPNACLINVLMRDVLRLPWLTFNIFSMTGLVIVTVMHTFPFVYLLASSALQSVDASYEEAAQILGASKLRTAFTITGPLVAPAVLSGTLLAFVNAIALFGSQANRAAGPHRDTADAHLRAVRLSARVRARVRALARIRVADCGGTLSAALVPGQALLRDARRQRLAAAADGARHLPLGGVRLCGDHLRDRYPCPLRDADRGVVLEVVGARVLEESHSCQL
jgi:ABC-type molybdate transport system permease subunit